MVDAQNERTTGRNRRRGRRRKGGQKPAEIENEQRVQQPQPERVPTPAPSFETPAPQIAPADAPVVRPADIAPPTIRSEEYCIHHTATFSEGEPMQIRTNMTTLRHLQVDHFGEATLFCDCLHNGPHEWPPSMQKLETAIELDQFLADSTNEA